MIKSIFDSHGIFPVFKRKGITTIQCLAELKNLLYKLNENPSDRRNKKGKLRMGHGGTLDPIAEGVVAIGLNDGIL